MVNSRTPIPSKRILSTPDISKGVFTQKVIDTEVAAVDSEAAGSKMLAHGPTLEAMLERLEVLEPLIIGTAQEETRVKSPGIASEETSANVPSNSSYLITDCLTVTGNFNIACPGPVLGQERNSNGSPKGATADLTSQSLETIVARAGLPSIISDGSPVTDSDVSTEELSKRTGCSRPLADTRFEGQERDEANAIVHPTDVQSVLTELAPQDVEKERSTPNPSSLLGRDDRPGDKNMLDCNARADPESVEVLKAHLPTPSPPARSRRGRSCKSVPDKDKQDYGPTAASLEAVDRVPSKINERRLRSAAGVVACESFGKRRKQPGTKRKRVARSENVASMHVSLVGGHRVNPTLEGIPDVHPLPPIAGPSQKSQRVYASKNVQQKPDTNTKAQSAPRSQALELLQSLINEARAQGRSKKDRHVHLPQQHDKKQPGRRSLASEQTRDEDVERTPEDMDRDVETPLTQSDENMSKSKRKRMTARTCLVNKLGRRIDDSTKEKAGRVRARANGRFADRESTEILAPGEGLVASSDVYSLRNCTKASTEINARDISKAGSFVGEAGEFGHAITAKIPQLSSTSNAKKRPPRKWQYHTEQVSAPIEHINRSSDARSKADLRNDDSSDGVTRGTVRESESKGEGILAGSGSRRENSQITSPHHQQLSSTTSNLLPHPNPDFPHTDSGLYQSVRITTTTSAQASRRSRRSNQTSTASSHQPGAGGRSHLGSSNQDENAGPGPWPSRTPSVASNSTTRRPRGFQPAEVGKSKPNADAAVASAAPPKVEAVTHSQGFAIPQRSKSYMDTEVTSPALPKAEAVTQSQTSATTQIPPKIQSSTKTMQATAPANSDVLTVALLAQTPEKQNEMIAELLAKATPKTQSPRQRKAQPLQETIISSPVVQAVTMDASRPELEPIPVETNGASSPSETSSIQIITNDEPRQSCWSRAVTTETAPPPKSEWDNSTNPIDDPTWMRTATLPPLGYRGPVAANFRNLPAYKLIGSKNTGVPSIPKKTEVTPSSSFSRQMAIMEQATLPPQPPRIAQSRTPVAVEIVDTEAPITPESKKLRVSLNTPKGTAKVPPHLRAQSTTPIAGESKGDHSYDSRAPHLRQSAGHSEANNDHDDIKAGEEIIAATANPTSPTHLQGRPTKKLPPVCESPLTAGPSDHQVVATPAPIINIDEELAAAEQIMETEDDAQIAAAVAAGEPRDDQLYAAGLQAGFDDEHIMAKHFQLGMGSIKGEDRADTVPPHLRASKQKQKAPAFDTKPQHQSSAMVQSASIAQDNYTTANTAHTGALKDVTNLRQNGKVSSPSRDGILLNGTESVIKKGKKVANTIDSGNGVSDLVGWDGKMAPALIGEDWAVRAQHGCQREEKLAVIKTWTEDHAVNPETDVVRVEDKLLSPISIKHPVTKPNPDEFNQAKRHLNADDHIQAYKAKHSSSVGNTTPESGGRMSKEEKRDARKRHAEEERNRVYPPNEHAPAANIYLRPAEFKDMRQVCFLHNHYVLKTACAHDLEETNELYWRQRLQETIDEGDPFLVAVHMGSKPINNIRDIHRKKSETIVGFAFAADYGLQTHAYRFTVELEMWVHGDHLHQGIGRSMLDRMLAALDPGYNLLECAPFLGGEGLSRWFSGSHCIVKTILVSLLHNEDNEKDIEWKKDWLSNKNDFKCCGTLPGMGHKFGKDVDITQMVLRTSASMPASPIS